MTALSGPMPTGSSNCGAWFDEPGQALVELVDLSGELFDALDEHAQRHVGGLGHRVLVSLTVAWFDPAPNDKDGVRAVTSRWAMTKLAQQVHRSARESTVRQGKRDEGRAGMYPLTGGRPREIV
ncbi:hypothetical protein [Streptomyces variegatus]|uniref:hypothetical protein n=1 Tax=Streptomyces variegatus TaxID=284040 RepID=UPI003C2C5D66